MRFSFLLVFSIRIFWNRSVPAKQGNKKNKPEYPPDNVHAHKMITVVEIHNN